MTTPGPEKRKGGRPPREDGPKLPREEVERLLVEGEVVVGDDGVEGRVWPSQREVARRFGVAPSLVAAFAKQHRCAERRAALEGAGADHGEVPGVVEEEACATTTAPEEGGTIEAKRRPGRPRKNDAPLISYEELDRLLVFGEAQVLDNGSTTTVYPTYRQLAERYGVAPSVIATYAKSRNCLKRRQQAAARVAVRTEEKLIELRADAIAVGEERLIQMIDDFLLGFERALKEGRVRSDNPTDVNTLARLKTFIQGGADSRQEVRAILSLESLQDRYARRVREEREVTPAMAGVIEGEAMRVDGVEGLARAENPDVLVTPEDSSLVSTKGTSGCACSSRSD